MRGESLGELRAAFEEWRGGKRHVREPAPGELMKRAREAVGVHGVGAVSRATKVDRRRLAASGGGSGETAAEGTPAFSRLELPAPVARAQAFAEVEAPNGMRVRLFTQTEGALRLLSSVLGAGDRP